MFMSSIQYNVITGIIMLLGQLVAVQQMQLKCLQSKWCLNCLEYGFLLLPQMLPQQALSKDVDKRLH